jgi:hypothetical protein
MSNPFLCFAMFFPRLTLLLVWLFSTLPQNSTPFVVDALMALVLPRTLIAWWAHELGMHPLISVLFVVLDLVEKARSVTQRPTQAASR